MKDKTINNIIQAWWNIQILVFLTLFILAPYRLLPLWCMICVCSLVEYSSKEYLGTKLSIEVGKRRKDGRGFDWDSSRSRSFDMKKTGWRQTIGTIRNILESTINETDR